MRGLTCMALPSLAHFLLLKVVSLTLIEKQEAFHPTNFWAELLQGKNLLQDGGVPLGLTLGAGLGAPSPVLGEGGLKGIRAIGSMLGRVASGAPKQCITEDMPIPRSTSVKPSDQKG